MKYYKKPEIKNNYKIRIVAASYLNGDSRRVAACKSFIYSVLAQTYKNIELFIVHDGPIECKQTKEDLFNSIKDDRVKFFETDERLGKFGYPHRKKYAFLNDDFDYIIFTNDDNYYTPAAIEIMVHTSEATDRDLVFCNMISSHILWFQLETVFEPEKLDLGGFMMKKELMKNFDFDLDGNCSTSDAKLIYDIKESTPNNKIAKINNVLYVHN